MQRAKKDLSLLLALAVPVIANGEVIDINNRYSDLGDSYNIVSVEDAILPEDLAQDNYNNLSYKKGKEKQISKGRNILGTTKNNQKVKYIDSNDYHYKNPNQSNYPLGALKKRGGLRR